MVEYYLQPINGLDISEAASMVEVFTLLVVGVVLTLLIVQASDIILVNLTSLSQKTGVGMFAMTALLLALGTSFPELSVGVAAAVQGRPNLSLGNVIGSNIANLSLVVGGAAFLGGAVVAKGVLGRKDIFYAFLASIAPFFLLLDRVLSRLDGLILVVAYMVYTAWVFGSRRSEVLACIEGEGYLPCLVRRLSLRQTKKEVAMVLVGLLLLVVSADLIVRAAGRLASILEVPILLVGLFLIAIGTSLPELALSLRAVRAQEADVLLGNIIGSTMANALLIVGITSLVSPIRVVAFREYAVATLAYVAIFALFAGLVLSGRKLGRGAGSLLVLSYALFSIIEFLWH